MSNYSEDFAFLTSISPALVMGTAMVMGMATVMDIMVMAMATTKAVLMENHPSYRGWLTVLKLN